MTERRNTNGTEYSFSFTQPYDGWQNSFIREVARKAWEEEQIEKELASLDAADETVQNMLTFPDVEAIMNKIKEA